MPRFSLYAADYSQTQTLPWYFWTDEERSYVIKQAYERLYLTSDEVKPYLDVTRRHYYTQFIIPAALVATYQYGLKNLPFFNNFYRKSPTQGRLVGLAFLGVATWTWLNFSPFYIQKQQSQEETLNLLYNKVGTGMKILNGFLPRTTTSTSIDKDTWSIYNQRNGQWAGTIYAEEDTIPPLLPKNSANSKWKRLYH